MISAFFIRRPIVAMVIAIVTVIVGLIAMLALPLAQFPEIVPPQIIVSTTYTGADAITIEQSVSTPLEQQMSEHLALSVAFAFIRLHSQNLIKQQAHLIFNRPRAFHRRL